MNCPKCDSVLVNKFYKGMLEVEACPNCRGMWLDANELDKLEDVVFADDNHKGSLIHHQHKTDFPCPRCNAKLDEFQYRLYDLKLDACIQYGHGFWLDAGEDERVLEIMSRRLQEISRKVSAEAEWKQTLKKMHSIFKKK